MKLIIFISILLYSFTSFASPIKTFSEIEKLKKNISKMKKDQIEKELLLIKDIVKTEIKTIIYDKTSDSKQLKSLSRLSSVLKFFPAKKDIKCDSLKNSLIYDFRSDWEKMPKEVQSLWPIIEKICNK